MGVHWIRQNMKNNLTVYFCSAPSIFDHTLIMAVYWHQGPIPRCAKVGKYFRADYGPAFMRYCGDHPKECWYFSAKHNTNISYYDPEIQFGRRVNK